MKFKTKAEKQAFRIGFAIGSKNNKRNGNKDRKVKPSYSKPKRTVFADDDFMYDDNGHIMGHYTCDGFFEPD